MLVPGNLCFCSSILPETAKHQQRRACKGKKKCWVSWLFLSALHPSCTASYLVCWVLHGLLWWPLSPTVVPRTMWPAPLTAVPFWLAVLVELSCCPKLNSCWGPASSCSFVDAACKQLWGNECVGTHSKGRGGFLIVLWVECTGQVTGFLTLPASSRVKSN